MSVRTPRTTRTHASRTRTVASPVVVTHVGDAKPDLSAAMANLREQLMSLTPSDKPLVHAAPAKLVARENRVCDQIDWSIVEPEHAARERDCQVWSPAQSPVNATVTNVEHYAPKSVTVLALPTLQCAGCTRERPCTHEFKVAGQGMGVCGDCVSAGRVHNMDSYVPLKHVETVAVQDYTGRLTRA